MKVLLIDKEAFIDWYFDHEIRQDFFYRHGILEDLRKKGEFNITLEYIMLNCGFLPQQVAVDIDNVILDANGDIDISYYDEILFA